jgi:L-lactate utilization protein LutB
MANLDRYLEQMADAVEKRGGKVFFASDGEDVVRYVGTWRGDGERRSSPSPRAWRPRR